MEARNECHRCTDGTWLNRAHEYASWRTSSPAQTRGTVVIQVVSERIKVHAFDEVFDEPVQPKPVRTARTFYQFSSSRPML